MADHEARGGTLILGGRFAGSYVRRYLRKRGETIVSRENIAELGTLGHRERVGDA